MYFILFILRLVQVKRRYYGTHVILLHGKHILCIISAEEGKLI